jgi:hypothetical protein
MATKSSTYFHYRDPDQNISWDAALTSNRCAFVKPDGSRCKNRVVIGAPLCYIHRLKDEHLVIKTSTNPDHGKGLYADDPTKPKGAIIFKKGPIVPYLGKHISKTELDRLYGKDDKKSAPYAFQYGRTIADAALDRSAASMANKRARSRANATLTDQGNLSVKKGSVIRNGQEIFTSYGSSYRFANNNSTNRNKRKF